MVGSINFLASLESQITSLGLRTVGWVGITLIVLLFIASIVNNRWPKLKTSLFVLITLLISGTTLLLVGSTIYLNLVSDSGGPVHWHAEVEFWACGTELELKDPYKFLSNKIGSPVLHEHNDKWIHLEGVVVDLEQDASLGHFIETVGGALRPGLLQMPINDDNTFIEDDIDGDQPRRDLSGIKFQDYIKQDEAGGRYLEFIDGQACGPEIAEVQVFAYQFDEPTNTYKQTKLVNGVRVLQQVDVGQKEIIQLDSAADYIIGDNSQIPPGDCIIIEFDAAKDFTDRLCNQYGLKDSQRCQEFGVSQFSHQLCYLEDVTEYVPGDDVQPEPTVERSAI